MIKYPLSKDPINADESFNCLKAVHNNMKKVLDNLNNATSLIKQNFHGKEFDAACEYIESIKDSVKNSNDNAINDILTKLTALVNNYNSEIVDAEGLPYPVNSVSYKVDYLSDGRIEGTRGSLDKTGYVRDNLSNTSTIVNSTNSIEFKNDIILGNDNSTKIDVVANGLKQENAVVDQKTNSEVKNDGSNHFNNNVDNSYQSNYHDYGSSLSNDEVSNIIDYILTSGMDYNENTGFLYQNVKYNWNIIVDKFLEKENLDNVVDTIIINDEIITCNLLNGDSFKLKNIANYDELKNSIFMYLGRLSSLK